MTVIGLCIALFFIWLFALAAYHKLGNVSYYSELMADYGLQAPMLKRIAAVGLALIELLLAVFLLLPATRNYALIVMIVLLVMYATAMSVQLILGRRQLNCGCAGPASNTRVSAVLVTRNIVLIMLAVLALLGGSQLLVSAYNLLLVACITGFMILMYLCAEQLITNSQQLALLKNS